MVGFYLFLILATNIYNLIFLNETFALYGTMKAIPPYQSALIIYGLITGGLILDEFLNYTKMSLVMMGIGTFICCLGMYYRLFLLDADANEIKRLEDEKYSPNLINFMSQANYVLSAEKSTLEV